MGAVEERLEQRQSRARGVGSPHDEQQADGGEGESEAQVDEEGGGGAGGVVREVEELLKALVTVRLYQRDARLQRTEGGRGRVEESAQAVRTQ